MKTICKCDKELITGEAMMRNDLMVTSLDFVKIVATIEDEYDIEIPDELLVAADDISVKDFSLLVGNIVNA